MDILKVIELDHREIQTILNKGGNNSVCKLQTSLLACAYLRNKVVYKRLNSISSLRPTLHDLRADQAVLAHLFREYNSIPVEVKTRKLATKKIIFQNVNRHLKQEEKLLTAAIKRALTEKERLELGLELLAQKSLYQPV